MKQGFGILLCDECSKILNRDPIVFKIKKAILVVDDKKRRETVEKTICFNCYKEIFKLNR